MLHCLHLPLIQGKMDGWIGETTTPHTSTPLIFMNTHHCAEQFKRHWRLYLKKVQPHDWKGEIFNASLVSSNKTSVVFYLGFCHVSKIQFIIWWKHNFQGLEQLTYSNNRLFKKKEKRDKLFAQKCDDICPECSTDFWTMVQFHSTPGRIHSGYKDEQKNKDK